MGDNLPLPVPAGTGREQVPDASTEIRSGKQHIRVEGQRQYRRQNVGQVQLRHERPWGRTPGSIHWIWGFG